MACSMDGSLLLMLTLNSGMCQRTKHRHRKAPTMTLSKSSRPADYLLMSNLICVELYALEAWLSGR